ncbi:unnamed protein product, partial [Scytosiphon promiscuus]
PERVLYDLDGVVHHKSEKVSSGHYMTFIRRHNRTWRLFDDNNVSEADETRALNKDALIFMYTRRPPS